MAFDMGIRYSFAVFWGNLLPWTLGCGGGQFIAVDLARGRSGGATCCHGLSKGGVVAGCD